MSALENKRSFVVNGNTKNRGDDMNESDMAMITGKALDMPLKAKAIALAIAAMASGIVQAEGTGSALAELCITNAQGVVAGYQDLEYLDTRVKKDGNALLFGQRIVTDFRPLDSDVVEMTVKFLSHGFGCGQFLWCDRVDGPVDTFSAGKMDTGCFRFDRGSATSGAEKCPAAAGTLYHIVADYCSRACTVNGKRAGMMECASSFSPPTNLVLFASFVF